MNFLFLSHCMAYLPHDDGLSSSGTICQNISFSDLKALKVALVCELLKCVSLKTHWNLFLAHSTKPLHSTSSFTFHTSIKTPLSTDIHTHICTQLCTQSHIQVCTHHWVHIHTHMHTLLYTVTDSSVHIPLSTHTHTLVYTGTHASVHTESHTCLHTQGGTH